MSTTGRAPADPRQHSIYQRGGGTAGTAEAATGMDTGRDGREPSRAEPARVPGAPGSGTTPGRPTPTYSSEDAYDAPVHPHPEDHSVIRELGAEAPEPGGYGGRNPFDYWIWGVAALLLALGMYLTFVPVLLAESIQEQMQSQAQSSYYMGHWSNSPGTIAIPLILVGTATAVAQLFVLSHRHARRSR
ncbi:hypothetical protein AC792_04895 [Arthrobacter sp. RIT-PI-e]|uniref:hypothetical protein n=1 Tax=Arthrobacter sp. RIT-PI-e TaxID=1681197 RepID=UPI0006762652|nr:hypothetical protein [Arthrobacter sp. RIT-PI-e]KNC19715.1 hypothetical protein AC792_04895 [Arthrobacter sp. RIT-PI-e]